MCAIPAWETKVTSGSGFSASINSFNFATFPTSLKAKTSFSLSPSTATPAESYPRYSRRPRPYQIRQPSSAIVSRKESAIRRTPETSGKLTCNQRIQDVLAVLLDEVVNVSKDSTNSQLASSRFFNTNASQQLTYHIVNDER